MRLGLGLGIGHQRGGGGPKPNPAPTDIVWAGSHTVAEDAALGTQVGGALSATDPGDTGTFSLAADANGTFGIGGDGASIIVTGVLDFETAPNPSITIRRTDSAGNIYDEVFAITVTDVSETAPEDPPPEDPPVIVDDPVNFDVLPYSTVADGSIKFAGKKKSNGLSAKMLHNFAAELGALEADTVYIMKWTFDGSLMANDGTQTAIGITFKTANDFWSIMLRGDGATGVDIVQIYGDDLWQQSSGFTVIDGGDAAHGDLDGPNWLKLQTSPDGTTIDISTGTGTDFDDVTWTEEFAAAAPEPFNNISDVSQWGLGAIFHADDSGPYVIPVEAWRVQAAFTSRQVMVPDLGMLTTDNRQLVTTGGTITG